MDLQEKFSVDPKIETEGVWESIGPDTKLLVARIGNPEFKQMYVKIPPAYKRMLKKDTLPEGKALEIMADIMSKTILLDWEGLSEGGKEIKYSQQKAKEIMMQYPQFMDAVTEIASDNELYRLSVREEAKGNLSSDSSGN